MNDFVKALLLGLGCNSCKYCGDFFTCSYDELCENFKLQDSI
jgi:hypothetical protein